MDAIETENPMLKVVLPRNYSRHTLDKQHLGELIDIIGKIGLGNETAQTKDIFARGYEYFLGKLAEAEGKGGGEFFTPQCIVKFLVRMLEPSVNSRFFDPC